MITIALASYNGEKYIKEQLDSLINQNTGCDFRIVVQDDCSSDGTMDILRRYEERYPQKIQVKQNDRPTGSPQGNFFKLLKEIDDDYVMLCDQDDVWLEDKIQLTYERMKQLEMECGKGKPLLVFSNVIVADEKMNVISESMADYQKTAPRHNGLNNYLVQNNVTGCTAIINRELLEYMKYEPEVCMMHDWWMALLASAFGHMAYMDKPLVKYRQHGGNQMGARAADDVSQYIERLSKGEEVRRNYDKMFKQAEIFLERYREELSDKQVKLLEGFISINGAPRIMKIFKIFRFRLFKSTWLWTLGQCFSI